MVMLVTTALFPHEAGTKVAKKHLEMIKKNPPTPEISETIAICGRATKKGFETLSVANVKKGKVEEALTSTVTWYQEYATSINGYKYEVNAYLDMAEAYKTIVMEPPE